MGSVTFLETVTRLESQTNKDSLKQVCQCVTRENLKRLQCASHVFVCQLQVICGEVSVKYGRPIPPRTKVTNVLVNTLWRFGRFERIFDQMPHTKYISKMESEPKSI